MARKTTTSSEVKARWIAKNYQRYTLSLRYDEDKQLIDYIEAHKADGTTELFRKALKFYAEKHPY